MNVDVGIIKMSPSNSFPTFITLTPCLHRKLPTVSSCSLSSFTAPYPLPTVSPRHSPPCIRRRHIIHASASPEQDRPTGNTPEDEVLHTELRAKVKELFGGRQNVRIDIDKDVTSVQFTVGNKTPTTPSSSSSATIDNQVIRSRRYILTFIAIVSLITGTVFTSLYYSGAVHGFDSNDDSHYEMPTYGTNSYIDPYQLLDDEGKQLQQGYNEAPTNERPTAQ